MKFRVRSKPKAEMQWYKGNQKIVEGQKFKTKYIDLGNDEYEVVLEISVSIRVRVIIQWSQENLEIFDPPPLSVTLNCLIYIKGKRYHIDYSYHIKMTF